MTEITARPVASGPRADVAGIDERDAERGLPLFGALLLLATVQLVMVLDNTIINVAIPTIQRSVGFGTGSIAWVVNGYVLAFGALLLLGGRSGDLLGQRTVLVVALVVFAAASLAVASNLQAAVLCVVIIGAGGWLFWKLIRVMARIQMPRRPGDARG